MRNLIHLCVNGMSEIFTIVIARNADVNHPQVKELLFKKLVAVWYGVSTMIRYLGYTEQDVLAAIENPKQETEK